MKRVSVRARDRWIFVLPPVISLAICSIFPSTGFHTDTLPVALNVISPSKFPPLGALTKYQSAPFTCRCDHIRPSAIKSGSIWSSFRASSRDIPLITCPFPTDRASLSPDLLQSVPTAVSKRCRDDSGSFSVARPSGRSPTMTAPALTISTIFSSVSGRKRCDSGSQSRR